MSDFLINANIWTAEWLLPNFPMMLQSIIIEGTILVICDIPESVQHSDLESTVTSMFSDIDAHAEYKWRTATDVIMTLKRPLLDSSIKNIAREHYLIENILRKLI